MLPPGDLAVASREELADNTRANVGGREFSNCKQTVTRFSGLSGISSLEQVLRSVHVDE